MKWTILVAILAAIAFPVHKSSAAPNVKDFGKGVWIYYIKQCGTPEAIAQRAEWAGLDYLIVKTHDGAKWHKNWTSGKYNSLVSLCHQRGIKVYAFGFNYGNHPDKEAELVIDSLKASDGYVYNVEGPFTRGRNATDVQQRAEKICKVAWQYRQTNCPHKVLGYSTYCRIHIGAGLGMRNTGVFRVFGRYTDVAMPQAYWSVFGQAPKHTLWEMCQAWAQMEDGWRQAGHADSVKPIIPTGVSYRPDISRSAVPVEQFVAFMEAAKGYYGTNIYVWHEMNDAHWTALRSFQARPEDEGEPEEYKQPPSVQEQHSWETEEEEIRKSEPSNFRIVSLWLLKWYGILTPFFICFVFGANALAGKEGRVFERPLLVGLVWPVPVGITITKIIRALVALAIRFGRWIRQRTRKRKE